MKKQLKGFRKIFDFTFRNQVKSKAWLSTTIVVLLLCLAIPAAIIVFAGDMSFEEPESSAVSAGVDKADGEAGEEPESVQIDTVYVVDETPGEELTFRSLSLVASGIYENVGYEWCGDSLETAQEKAVGAHDLIVLIQKQGPGYTFRVLIPDQSELERSDAWDYAYFLESYTKGVMIEKSGLDSRKTAELSTPVYGYQMAAGEAEESIDAADLYGEDGSLNMETLVMLAEQLKGILKYVLAYLVIMFMYFMIVMYGQGIANSVVLEKSSKLMDTFLVSVKPSAMIFGKVTAQVLSCVLQILLWIAGLVISCIAGVQILKAINPDTQFFLVAVFSSLKGFGTLFSLPGAILSVGILIAGFVLYSTIAAICGAVADKQEDLSSSIGVFTMILLVSFMASLYGGLGSGTVPMWMNLVPFTATLVLPSGLLLGDCSIGIGLASLCIMLVCILVLSVLAGRIYKMMVFYRGKVPSIGQIGKMLAADKE